MLHHVTFGEDESRPPILIAHGLFGSARNWGAIAKRLALRRRVIAVDMRNHGQSFRADTQSYPDMAGDLAQVITANGGLADVLGHSMGGKAAMVLALEHPDLVRRLMVADIAPFAYGHSHAPLVAAMQGLDPEGVASREEAHRALMGEVADAQIRAFLLQSLDIPNRRWRLNLDVLGREMAKLTGWPEDIEGSYPWPAFFLAGANSDYIRPEHRARIKALFPMAQQARLPGAGHWLHAERPREFIAAAETFLNA